MLFKLFCRSPTLGRYCKAFQSSCSAACWTMVLHSFRGRPIFRTYLDQAGCKEPGRNVNLRKGSQAVARAMRPNTASCCFNRSRLRGRCRALSRTTEFGTREKYAGGIRKTTRKHRQKKPSSLRVSHLFSQAEARPYNKQLMITARKICSFLLVESVECLQTSLSTQNNR